MVEWIQMHTYNKGEITNIKASLFKEVRTIIGGEKTLIVLEGESTGMYVRESAEHIMEKLGAVIR